MESESASGKENESASDTMSKGCLQGLGIGCGIIIALNLIWLVPALGLFGLGVVGTIGSHRGARQEIVIPKSYWVGDVASRGNLEVTLLSLQAEFPWFGEGERARVGDKAFVAATIRVRNVADHPVSLNGDVKAQLVLYHRAMYGPTLDPAGIECASANWAYERLTRLQPGDKYVFKAFFELPRQKGLMWLSVRDGFFSLDGDFRFKSLLPVSPVPVVADSPVPVTPEESDPRAVISTGLSVKRGSVEVRLLSLDVRYPRFPGASGARVGRRRLIAAKIQIRNTSKLPVSVYKNTDDCFVLSRGEPQGPVLASADAECAGAYGLHRGLKLITAGRDYEFTTYFDAPYISTPLWLLVRGDFIGSDKDIIFKSIGPVSTVPVTPK